MTEEEFVTAIEDWIEKQNLWKSAAEDWEDVFALLMEAKFSKEDAFYILNSITNLIKSEYGE